MDIKHLIILICATAFTALSSVWQYLRHKARLAKIPVRIHVNGTRGKSSVTRLIAAGLRAGGMRVCAKTTGTLPRMIMPDGREYPIFRPGRPNISEQLRIVDIAAANKAKVLIVECMALLPWLQWISQSRLIRATHAVITNARADHLDVMGPTETDVANALCGMVPMKGTLFTAERRHLDIVKTAARDRKSELIAITKEDIGAITPDELDRFSYIEHAENIALALKVCESVGVDRQTALSGMFQAAPDPGALTDHEIHFFGRKLYFVNGFAANDPESTHKIWNIAWERYPRAQNRIALFNCRADRPDRSILLGKSCVHWHQADHIVLMGTGTYLFAKSAIDSGIDFTRIHYADDLLVEEIFELIVGLAGPSALIVGMGNIGGQGLEMVRHFKNRAVIKKMPEAANERARDVLISPC